MTRTLGPLAVSLGLLAAAARASPALAGPAPLLAPRWVVNDWVTVDGNGLAHTVTPSVTTDKNGPSTVSPPPYLLTGSVFTVLSGTQVATTTATLQPPPTATAASGAGGVFAVCHNAHGAGEPFCQPKPGADLSIGTTYYGEFCPSTNGEGGPGWDASPLEANQAVASSRSERSAPC